MTKNLIKQTPKAQPIALVCGFPVPKLPDDLYIPDHALEVCLEEFAGPLDLLFYLIKKQDLDILDIPISHITAQYISYIKMMDVLQMELVAEYLPMVALLAEIKSKMLLPNQSVAEIEELNDPRAFLVKKLQEYAGIKKAAEEIDLLARYERDIFDLKVDVSGINIKRSYPELSLTKVFVAFQDVLKRTEQLSHYKITKELLSVRERMSVILEKLSHSDDGLAFSTLFTYTEGKMGVVVCFLSILELSRAGLLEIIQSTPLVELQVKSVGL